MLGPHRAKPDAESLWRRQLIGGEFQIGVWVLKLRFLQNLV